MRSKLYSLALTIVLSLAAFNVVSAQNADPAPPVAPVSPTAPTEHVRPQSRGISTKMLRLQDQVVTLTKEIGDITREQSLKVAALAREQAEVVRQSEALRFDADFGKKIARSFSNFGRMNDGNESDLQKQVAGGDVKDKTKTFSKSYPVDAGDRLLIDNRYGKITVNTWGKNEIKVDAEIKAYSLSDDEAQKLLDETNVVANKDGSGVSFTTNIQQSKGSWWGTIVNNGILNKVRKVTIDYVVYMPAKNPLTINIRYGSVSLPNLDGKVIINSSYSNIKTKALSSNDNSITVRYGDADITSLGGSDMNIAYGKLALESADRLKSNISYSEVKIGKLNNSADINLRYGDGLSIKELGKQLTGLNINSSYADVKVGSTNDVNADFSVTVHYGSFTHSNNAKINSQSPDKGNTRSYKGQLGKGSADNTIKVNSKYSTVRFD